MFIYCIAGYDIPKVHFVDLNVVDLVILTGWRNVPKETLRSSTKGHAKSCTW